jgi:hypothetical protein
MIKTIKDYFDIEELVPRDVFDKYGERAWMFFDPLALECLLIVRKGIGKPINVNNWHKGGNYDERGLRPNTCPLVKNKTRLYLSFHIFGKAFDFTVTGMSSEDVRDWIDEHADEFPCKVRLERKMRGKQISWVHLDIRQEDKNPKVYQFDV